MMAISEFHAAHIGRVRVGFILSGPNLDPRLVTDTLCIQPTNSAQRGEVRHNAEGVLLAPHVEGFWRVDTEGRVSSKDINDHLTYLLALLLPHRKTILMFRRGGEAYFDVLWESTYLHAGTGPLINQECLSGVARLGAGMGFDIYHIRKNLKS